MQAAQTSTATSMQHVESVTERRAWRHATLIFLRLSQHATNLIHAYQKMFAAKHAVPFLREAADVQGSGRTRTASLPEQSTTSKTLIRKSKMPNLRASISRGWIASAHGHATSGRVRDGKKQSETSTAIARSHAEKYGEGIGRKSPRE